MKDQISVKIATSLLALSIISQSALCYAAASAPSDIFIGGAFRIIDPIYDTVSGNYSIQISETAALRMAAFMMAVDLINDHSDGFMDDILVNTTIKVITDINQRTYVDREVNYVYDGSTAAHYIGADESIQVLGVIDALNDDSTGSSASIFNGWKIPTVLVNSSLSTYNHGNMYPYDLQLQPINSYVAFNLFYILENFNWQKAAVLYTNEPIGVDSFAAFDLFARSYDFTYLTLQSLPENQPDMSLYISAVQQSGATIIVLMMTDAATVRFLVQAYAAGLLTDGTQILGSAFSESLDEFRAQGVPAELVPAIMQGYVTTRNAPELYYHLPAGQEFLNHFRALVPTAVLDANNTVVRCSDRTDDSEASDGYLYQYQPLLSGLSSSLVAAEPICAGISSFSTFDVNGSNLDPMVLYTFASVQLLAVAIDKTIKSGVQLSGNSVYDTILDLPLSVSLFDSIIGAINIYSGDELDDLNGQGVRVGGHIFELLAFSDRTVVNYSATTSVLSVVGTVFDSTVDLCATTPFVLTTACESMQFRGGAMPSDTKPDIYSSLVNEKYKAILVTFGLLAIFESVACAYYYIHHRNTRTVKMGQLRLMLVLCFGGFLVGVRILSGIAAVTVASCSAQYCLDHIAFNLVFGTILFKLRRVHIIVNKAGFRRVKITEWDILKQIAALTGAVSMLLFALVVMRGIHVGQYIVPSPNQETITNVCYFHGSVGNDINYTLCVGEISLLAAALYFLVQTMDVPHIVNETSVFAPSVVGSIIVIVLTVLTAMFLFSDPALLNSLLQFSSFVVASLIQLMYASDKHQLIRKEMAKKKETKVKKEEHSVSTRTNHRSNKNEMSVCEEDEDFILAKNRLILQKTYMDKAKYVQKNIDVWKALMVILAEDIDSDEASRPDPRSSNNNNNNNWSTVHPSAALVAMASAAAGGGGAATASCCVSATIQSHRLTAASNNGNNTGQVASVVMVNLSHPSNVVVAAKSSVRIFADAPEGIMKSDNDAASAVCAGGRRLEYVSELSEAMMTQV